jgi:endonuclease YncB( thermonuclease family)
VACYKVDRFQRQVCRLKTTDGRDVADVMLSEGLAWYPEDFSAEDVPSDRERYRRLQREAQAAKRGLWVVPDPMPPKECRQRRRTGLSCEHRETTEGTE